MKNWQRYELETAVCPLCGANAPQKKIYDFDPFRVVACTQCGLRFLSPRLTEKDILHFYQGEDYYAPSYARQGYDDYLDLRDAWVKTFKKRLRAVAAYKSAGRLLDIGCGPGFFLQAAKEMGYDDVWGIDPSSFIVNVARKEFGDRILEGTIESDALTPGTFDILTAFDVFEHIYRPINFVNRAHDLLREGGILAFTTPDPTSALAKIFGRQWVSFKMPEHVFYWSSKTARIALEEKFEILEIRRAGQYATLSFLFRRLFQIDAETKGALKVFLSLLAHLKIYADNGSITVIARKK